VKTDVSVSRVLKPLLKWRQVTRLLLALTQLLHGHTDISSMVEMFKKVLNPKDETTMLSLDVGNHLPTDTASHPRKTEISIFKLDRMTEQFNLKSMVKITALVGTNPVTERIIRRRYVNSHALNYLNKQSSGVGKRR
jgi:hypothetical protein